jgi:hypothetical protein
MFDILEGINESELNEKIKGFIITHENIDTAYEKYIYGILDTFDHCLNEEEADRFLTSFTEHNLKQEYKFIEFMKLAYELNEYEPIIMNLPFHEIESTYILYILNILDYADKVAFIEQIRRIEGQRTYHRIKQWELLQLYTKLATREIYFPIFHFTRFPMTMVGNFDLSFPLFCQYEDDMNRYKSIAEKCGLFIRDIVIKNDSE